MAVLLSFCSLAQQTLCEASNKHQKDQLHTASYMYTTLTHCNYLSQSNNVIVRKISTNILLGSAKSFVVCKAEQEILLNIQLPSLIWNTQS